MKVYTDDEIDALDALATSYIDANMPEAGHYLRGMIDRALSDDRFDHDRIPGGLGAYAQGWYAVRPGDVVTGQMALEATEWSEPNTCLAPTLPIVEGPTGSHYKDGRLWWARVDHRSPVK